MNWAYFGSEAQRKQAILRPEIGSYLFSLLVCVILQGGCWKKVGSAGSSVVKEGER